MKICRTCEVEKQLIEFSLRKDGRQVNECKQCAKKRSNEWYWANREKSLEDRKKRYQETKEYTLRKSKERYEEHKERILKRNRELNKTPERRAKSNQRTREWNKKNPEKIRARIATWKRNNKEKALAHQYVLWGLRLNVIQKPSECQGCGKKIKVEAHHRDYTKQLEVMWLCKLCHEQEHHRQDNVSSCSSELNILSNREKV